MFAGRPAIVTVAGAELAELIARNFAHLAVPTAVMVVACMAWSAASVYDVSPASTVHVLGASWRKPR